MRLLAWAVPALVTLASVGLADSASTLAEALVAEEAKTLAALQHHPGHHLPWQRLRRRRRHGRRASLLGAAAEAQEGLDLSGAPSATAPPGPSVVASGAPSATAEGAGVAPREGGSRFHPLADRALRTMSDELRDLGAQRRQTDEAREKMARLRGRAVDHMSDAISIRREEERAQSLKLSQEKLLKRLKSQETRIKKSHDSLKSKLKTIMEPKIKAAEKRLEKQDKALAKAELLKEAWEGQAKKFRGVALAALQARRQAQAKLKAAEEEFEKAKRLREEAEDTYQTSRTQVSKDIQAFQYATTKYDASLAREKTRRQDDMAQNRSVEKLHTILAMETKRIDQALALGTTKIDKRIAKANKVYGEASEAATKLRDEYGKWQADQRVRAEKAGETRAKYEQSVANYVNQRDTVTEKAKDKAGSRAEHVSDWAWDDWAWQGRGQKGLGNPGELEEEVHFSNATDVD